MTPRQLARLAEELDEFHAWISAGEQTLDAWVIQAAREIVDREFYAAGGSVRPS